MIPKTNETMEETVRKVMKAMYAEKEQEEKNKLKKRNKSSIRERQGRDAMNKWKRRSPGKEECFKCKKRGHKAVDCGKFNCYNCDNNGHLATSLIRQTAVLS